MVAHGPGLDPGKHVVDEVRVLFAKLPTIHRWILKGAGSSFRTHVPGRRSTPMQRRPEPRVGIGAPVIRTTFNVACLVHHGPNEGREGCPGAIQPGFDGAEVAVRDLGDVFVRLAFEFPEDEHLSVMHREPRN